MNLPVIPDSSKDIINMKFLIKDNPVSYDEIYQAMLAYSEERGHTPTYILVHPYTRRNIIISSQDEYKGMSYNVVHHTVTLEKGIKSTTKIFDLYMLMSLDVEPGFMILCG